MKNKFNLKIGIIAFLFLTLAMSGMAQISIPTAGTAITQDFDGLSNAGSSNVWTDNSTITGWYTNRIVYVADEGTSTSGGIHSYGAVSSTERALGLLSSGSVNPAYVGARFVNSTGAGIASFDVAYRGEQWRRNATAHTLVFEYQIGATSLTTGTWTAVTSLDFTAPQTGAAGALDGNIAANYSDKTATITAAVNAGQEIWFRWTKSATSSPGLAIDNFSITANASGSPSLSATPNALTGFSYLEGSGPSTEQSFELTGTNLDGDDVVLSPPADYEISLTTGGAFSATDPITLAAFDGTATTVYVRLAAGLTNASSPYNSELIDITGGGASAITVSCSGDVMLPTLNVSQTSLSGFTYIQGAGPSAEQSFNISGVYLSGTDVTLTPPTDYEISLSSGGAFLATDPITLTAYAGTSTPVYVRLIAGLTVAASPFNLENITIAGGGASTVTVECNGTVTPVPVPGCATDLFISEYVEGSSNNKYIEIYNGTGASVDLTDYKLQSYANGSATPTTDVTLSGSLADGATIVYKNSSAVIYGGTATALGSINFNGDDAVALYRISTSSYVDIFGTIGEDPGTEWTSGTFLTVNKTLVRNSDVTTGVTANPGAGFPTLATEWIQYNQDEISYLGAHSINCPINWTGATSNAWSEPTNWSTGSVPTASDDVVIVSGMPFNPSVDMGPALPAECKKLTVNPSVILYIGPGMALTAHGNTTVNGTLTLKSDATGTGSFIDNGTITGSGTFYIENYLTGSGGPTPNGRFWYIGTPVSTATSGVFSASGDNRLWSYSENPQGYSEITTDGVSINPLQGYVVRLGATETINFSSTTFNTGSFGAADNLSRTGTGIYAGYNLVSNPYPSALDFSSTAMGLTRTNIRPTIWYKTGAVYATYNSTSDIGTNGGVGQIPAMQAFWVRVNYGQTVGTLMVDNAARVHGTHAFYKNANTDNVFRFSINGTDEAVVSFFGNAIDANDDFDSEKMFVDGENTPQLYTLTSDYLKTAINGLPELGNNEVKIVSIGFKTETAGNYTLSATNLPEFNSDIPVLLEDTELGIVQDLRQNSSYSFNAGVVENANRFKLHFGSLTTSIIENENNQVSVYSYGKTLYVNTPQNNSLVQVYDILGNLVLSQLSKSGLNAINTSLGSGIYMVKIQNNDNITTQKIVINK